ncbi:hypothetical protein KM043_005079 [Ampulex compressa]|nr:hypothetical protein KM043_005079 [Ampulex compressa]
MRVMAVMIVMFCQLLCPRQKGCHREDHEPFDGAFGAFASRSGRGCAVRQPTKVRPEVLLALDSIRRSTLRYRSLPRILGFADQTHSTVVFSTERQSLFSTSPGFRTRRNLDGDRRDGQG